MKKLLNMLTIFSLFPLVSLNTTSCFFRHSQKDKDTVFDKINKANNINVAGLNLGTDTSNDNTKKVILDEIGLTKEEQSEVALSGILMENKKSAINFRVDEKDIVKDVKWNTFATTLPTDYYMKDSIIFKGILFTIFRSEDTSTKPDEGIYKSEDGINFTFFQKGKFNNFSYNASQDKLYISSTSLGLCTIDENMSWTEYSIFKTYFVVSYDNYIYCIKDSGGISANLAFSISGNPNDIKDTTFKFSGTGSQLDLAIYDNKIFLTNNVKELAWAHLAEKPDDHFNPVKLSVDLNYTKLKMANNKLFMSTSNDSIYQIKKGDTPTIHQVNIAISSYSKQVMDFCSDENHYMYTCGQKTGTIASYIYYSKDGETDYKNLDDFSEYNNISSVFSFKNSIIFDATLAGSTIMKVFLWNKYLLD